MSGLFGKAPPLGPTPPWAGGPQGPAQQQSNAQQGLGAAQQSSPLSGLGDMLAGTYMGQPIMEQMAKGVLTKDMIAELSKQITAMPTRYPSSIGQVSIPDPHAITSAVHEMQMDMRQMRQSMTVMHDALAHLSEHQSILLSYITYLRPEGEPPPEDPVSLAEWTRVQAVTGKLNAALGR